MGSEPKAGELVERLTFAARAWHGWDIEDLLREAATLLSSQEAEIAELKNVIENGNWGDKWRKRAEASESRATEDARKLAVKFDEANALVEELSRRLAALTPETPEGGNG